MPQWAIGLIVCASILSGIGILVIGAQALCDGWSDSWARKIWEWTPLGRMGKKRRKEKLFDWVDVRRDREHKCVTPANVKAWDRDSGHPYAIGDVIECKTCAQRWRCTSLGYHDAKHWPSLAEINEYAWTRVKENEDVFK